MISRSSSTISIFLAILVTVFSPAPKGKIEDFYLILKLFFGCRLLGFRSDDDRFWRDEKMRLTLNCSIFILDSQMNNLYIFSYKIAILSPVLANGFR